MAYNFPKRGGTRYFQESGGELIEKYSDEKYPEFFEVVLDNWMTNENIAKKIVEKLSLIYELKNKEAIGQYLSYNKFLLPALEECYNNLKTYFKNNESLVLELIQDPMDNIEKLVMYIITTLPPKEAINVLREFYRGWWISYPSNLREHIVIDVEST